MAQGADHLRPVLFAVSSEGRSGGCSLFDGEGLGLKRWGFRDRGVRGDLFFGAQNG
jgi:hypothetical protein